MRTNICVLTLFSENSILKTKIKKKKKEFKEQKVENFEYFLKFF